jgi:dGTPase
LASDAIARSYCLGDSRASRCHHPRSLAYQKPLKITQKERRMFSSKKQSERTGVIGSISVRAQQVSDQIVKNGYVRSLLTSDLIGKRLRSIDIEVDETTPALSKLQIPDNTRFEIDVLKHLTYELHIRSPRLKLIEYRGSQIVSELFECFDKDVAGDLLPDDWRQRLQGIASFKNKEEIRKRMICDLIAGMTDAYALDVYSRLKTTNPSHLFHPI